MSEFKRINFRAPDFKSSIVGIIVLGIIFSFLGTYFDFLNVFDSFLDSWVFSSVLFIVPALFYGSILDITSKRSDARRTYLMSLINMSILFLGLVLSVYSEIGFLFLIGVMLSHNVIGYAGSNASIGVLPILCPFIYFGPVFAALHYTGIFIFALPQVLAFLGLGLGTFLIVYFVEKLFKTVVPVSAVELFSNFLNKNEMSLDIGKDSDVLLNNLVLKNSEKLIFTIPWIHPGPLRDIGGGGISGKLIESINEDLGEDTGGFFWHNPSFHDVDPCDPEISEDVLDECSFEDVEYHDECTKLLENDDLEIKLYGQRIGENYLIFLKVKGADDYDNSIFRAVREKSGKNVAFVDTHQLQPGKQGALLSRYEERSEKIIEECLSFLEELEEAEEYELKAGFEISEGKDKMALVEEIGEEKFLILGMDRNGLPDWLRDDLEKFDEDYDKVVSLTTDSHQTIEFLEESDASEAPSMELVESAEEGLEKVRIGLTEKWLEDVRLMDQDFHKFFTGVAYSVLSFPVLLALIYIIYLFALI